LLPVILPRTALRGILTGSLVIEKIFCIPAPARTSSQRAQPRLHARHGRDARSTR
jgi:hypothetical protein